MNNRERIITVVCLLLLTGCAQRHLNHQLKKYEHNKGYRFYAEKTGRNNTNSLFVCLTFSGGGTRSAAFSYGVMKALKETKITWPPGSSRKVRLLDEVDVISSVSGGSFTAAYYGLYGDGLFRDFKKRFLDRNIQGELIASAFHPINWIRLMSGRFSRIDLAAEIYHKTLFGKATFAEIRARSPRPFIVMNATNMTTGSQFPFRQSQFDVIGSDLEQLPVASAVAASSAFPVLLSPITLKNYPSPENYNISKQIQSDMNDANRLANSERYRRGRNMSLYAEDKKGHPYLHLIDGGVADNLGLRMIIDEYRHGFIGQLFNGQGRAGETAPIKKFLVIVVNARNEVTEDIDRSPLTPKTMAVAYKSATVSMDNYTSETVDRMRGLVDSRKHNQDMVDDVAAFLRENGIEPPNRPPFNMTNTEQVLVEISFEKIPDKKTREELLNYPTSFKLKREQVDKLIDWGDRLVNEDRDLNEFLNNLNKPQ